MSEISTTELLSDLPELITAKQLSEFLGVSVDTLANERHLKVGVPYVKFNQRVRYLRKDVVAYIDANRQTTRNYGS